MAYPKIKTKTTTFYIVIGKDGYSSKDDPDEIGGGDFTTKAAAEQNARECDEAEPRGAPHKVVKMKMVIGPAEVGP